MMDDGVAARITLLRAENVNDIVETNALLAGAHWLTVRLEAARCAERCHRRTRRIATLITRSATG